VALYQKLILLGLLVQVIAILTQFALSDGMRQVLLYALIPVALTTTVFAFLLAVQVYGTGLGALLGVLALLPGAGLIVVVIINLKATSVLGAYGYQVGMLGVPLSEFND
jgi:hypothetical protein